MSENNQTTKQPYENRVNELVNELTEYLNSLEGFDPSSINGLIIQYKSFLSMNPCDVFDSIEFKEFVKSKNKKRITKSYQLFLAYQNMFGEIQTEVKEMAEVQEFLKTLKSFDQKDLLAYKQLLTTLGIYPKTKLRAFLMFYKFLIPLGRFELEDVMV
jgi:hypothetical protein